MIRIPVYVGQIIDATTVSCSFLLLFFLSKEYHYKKNYLIAIFSTIVISFIDTYFNAASDILIPLIILLLIKPIKNHFTNKLILFLFSYLIITFSSSFSGYLVTRFIDIRHLNNISTTTYFITIHTILLYMFTLIIALASIYLFNIIKNNIDLNDTIIRKTTLFALIILVFSIAAMIYISRLLKQQAVLLLLIILIMLIISTLTFLGLFFYIKSYLKQVQTDKKLQKFQDDQIYLTELQNNYNNLRRFKHDYKNLLLSVSVLLSENKVTSAKESLNKFLKMTDQDDFRTDNQVKVLSQISDDLISGLIVSKLAEAKHHGIKVHLEIDNGIKSFGSQQADIIRILGIILDNAIESTSHTSPKTINFALLHDKGTYEFIIQNTILVEHINLEQIQQLGYTTKTEHSGLGLATVHQICDLNGYFIQYKSANYSFTTTLTI